MWKDILKAQYMAGDYVTYKGLSKEQIRYAGDDPFGLEVGTTYQLESVDVQKWKTYFTIKGLKGRFNSLGFELEDDGYANNPEYLTAEDIQQLHDGPMEAEDDRNNPYD